MIAPNVRPQSVEVVRRSAREVQRRRRNRFLLIRIASLFIVLTAWQIYGSHTLSIIFAPFTTVIQDGVDLFVHGPLFGATLYSVAVFFAGLVIGSFLGIVFGLLLGRSMILDAALNLYIFAIYSTPMVVLIPLITLWFGFGLGAQLLIVVLFVFFPIVVTVYNGTKSVNPALLEVGRSFRATEMQIWRHIVLPAVVPFIATGISQGVAMGLVGMFISEIFTALSGIGQVLETAANAYHTAQTLATILVIMILGILFRWGTTSLQRRLAPWSVEGTSH